MSRISIRNLSGVATLSDKDMASTTGGLRICLRWIRLGRFRFCVRWLNLPILLQRVPVKFPQPDPGPLMGR